MEGAQRHIYELSREISILIELPHVKLQLGKFGDDRSGQSWSKPARCRETSEFRA